LAAPATARAEEAARDWPSRPVRLVVPFAPGGTTDIIGRQYAEFLRARLGQPVLVENRAGAATNLGAEVVARAEPDGLTLLLGAGLLAANPVWGPKPSFDPLTALAPVSLITETSYLICAGPRFGARTPADLVARARAAPGRHTIASAQLDVVVGHMTRGLGIALEHVGYRGGAPAMTDAIAGQVDMVIALVPVLLPSVREGKLHAIGATGTARPSVLPAVPTFRESGFPDAVQTSWNGLFAPAGTPAPVIRRLLRETDAYVTDPEVGARLREQGIEPRGAAPAELARLLREEMAAHEATARALGVTAPR
ncbi:MAG: tripartite tricarboxylate transporter substrate binding protein, partial [Acetobacteraceae bacterium]|nr:tripartite tricarboxylate transporter substrate binding protein [Acetobacteraceae bacterium]